jgi:ABC-type sulfate transport system substrate-binding protein
LILIIDKETAKSDQGLREGILRYVLSRDGQLEAIRAGFFPVDPAFIRKQLDGISGPQVR